jgi:hypothetical protein
MYANRWLHLHVPAMETPQVVAQNGLKNATDTPQLCRQLQQPIIVSK